MFVLVLALLIPTAAPAPLPLHAFVGAGYQASPGGAGASAIGGLRLEVARHVALSFDAGYGFLSSKQDRWWLMPSVALVLPTSHARFDIGAGLGLGTSSAFATWDDYAHDRTAWATEAVPAVRGHIVAAFPITPRFELFARLDVASQLLEGNTLGWRHGDAPTRNTETMWLNFSLGGQFRLL